MFSEVVKMKRYHFDKQKRFVIDSYDTTRPFASFLPGIAGPMGIPMWVFYVNRGQGITSFGVENVLWVWCPNAPFETMDTAYGGGDWNKVQNYYPGDAYVDWLCFDGYNWGTSAFGQSFDASWAGFDEIFSQSYQVLQTINSSKPIIIGEFASTEDGGDKAAWVRDAFQSLEQNYPQIRAVIWFHINKETDWRINSSPEVLSAFADAMGSDYWQPAWPGFEKDQGK